MIRAEPHRRDRLLGRKAEVERIDDHLQAGLILAVAAGHADGQHRLALRVTSVGESVMRGRLPGAMQFGCPGQVLKLCKRLPNQMPVLPTSSPLQPLGVAAITLPWPSATRHVVVSRSGLPNPRWAAARSSRALPPRGSPGR